MKRAVSVGRDSRLQTQRHQRGFAQRLLTVKLEHLFQIVGALMESGPIRGALKPPVQASTLAAPVLGHANEALGCRARLERLLSVGLINI